MLIDDDIPPSLRGQNDDVPPSLRGGNDDIPPSLRTAAVAVDDDIPPSLRGAAPVPPAPVAEAPPSPSIMGPFKNAFANVTEPLRAPFRDAETLPERLAAPAKAVGGFAARPLFQQLPGTQELAEKARNFQPEEDIVDTATRTGRVPYGKIAKRVGMGVAADLIPQNLADVGMLVAGPKSDRVMREAAEVFAPRLAKPIFGGSNVPRVAPQRQIVESGDAINPMQVRETAPVVRPEELPALPQRTNAALEEIPPSLRPGAVTEPGAVVRERLPAAGETPEAGLPEVRQSEIPDAPPRLQEATESGLAVPEVPPAGPQGQPLLREPAVSERLPIQQPGLKTGEPHALFAYNDDFGPDGSKRAIYNVFGDPENPAVKARGWGSSVTREDLEKAGIPITGREPRAAKYDPADLDKLFPKPASGEEGALSLGREVQAGEPSTMDTLKKNFYDRFEPIKYKEGSEIAPEFPQAGGKYTPSYVQARELSGRMRGASQELLEDVNHIISPLKDFNDREALNRIYSMRNFADLDRAGKTTSGITADIAESELARLKTELGPERFNRIAKVSDDLADIQNTKALNMLVDAKVITPETAQMLRERYPNYMRSEVLDEELAKDRPEFNRAPSGSNAEPLGRNNKSFLKTKEGTDKNINTDVIDVVRRSLVTKVSAAEKQRVIDSIAKEFGQEIGTSIFKNGKMVTEVDPKKIPEGFVKSNIKSSDGKVFAVRKDVQELLEGMDKQQTDLITKSMSAYNQLFKSGATTYRAPFVLSNLFRDMQEFFTKGRSVQGQTNRLAAYAQALYSSVKESLGIPDKTFKDWMKGGGSYGGMVTSYPKDTPIPSRLLPAKEKMQRMAMNVATLPFEAIRIPAEVLENTTRLAEYIRLKKSQLPKELQILASRDVTVDFDKAGNSIKLFNNYIPFLNPTVQGTINIARAFKDQPLITSGKIAAYVAAPTIALYKWNRQFPNDDLVDPYIKDNFWYINTGATREVDGKELPLIMTIRKGETAQLFATPLQRLLEKASKDLNYETRRAGDTASGFMGDVASFITPPVIKEPIEQTANFDLFRKGPIVSDRLKNVQSGKQFTQGTTNTSRRLGELTGVSPVRFEHAVQGVYPAAKQGLEAADVLLNPKPELPRKDKGMFERSKSFQPLVRTPSGYFSQEEEAARRFEKTEAESTATAKFMFKESYRRYLEDPTPENEALVQKWMAIAPPESRKRTIKDVNMNFGRTQMEPEERARRLLPLKKRARFSQSLEDLRN